jgi:hypothetical protein
MLPLLYCSHAQFKPGEEKTADFKKLGGDKANQRNTNQRRGSEIEIELPGVWLVVRLGMV